MCAEKIFRPPVIDGQFNIFTNVAKDFYVPADTSVTITTGMTLDVPSDDKYYFRFVQPESELFVGPHGGSVYVQGLTIDLPARPTGYVVNVDKPILKICKKPFDTDVPEDRIPKYTPHLFNITP